MVIGIVLTGLIAIIDQTIVSLPQYDAKSYSSIFTKPWTRLFVLALGV